MFELSAGQIVADKYRIDGIMGTGGMGIVVAATHVELDQRVAIKFLRAVGPEALARFQREARLLVRLKSPHVARVFDVGALDDDTPYIVMEHLDGSDLATVASARKKLPVEEAVDYVLQAIEAVADAHALGMVHRDLKPANLFLARGPGGTTTVKVLDFGVSKILDDRAAGPGAAPRGGDLTNEGVALGSPGYMSPEQMTSARDVDERSDIFSIGALLYRLVGGQTPYKGTSIVSLLASMATEPLAPLRSLAPDAPEAYAAIVARCLAQDKALRFPTVAHLAHALLPFATRRGRLMVEQICATLNVTFPDDADDTGDADATNVTDATGDALGSTQVRPAQLPVPAQARVPMPAPLAMPSPASFAPAPTATARERGPFPHAATLAIGLAVLVAVTGVFAWRAQRAQAPGDDAGASSATSATTTLTPVPVPEPLGASPAGPAVPAAVTATTPAPPANARVAPTATAATVEQKPKGATPASRPRPHASAVHPATGGGASPPPNPADVPGGRH